MSMYCRGVIHGECVNLKKTTRNYCKKICGHDKLNLHLGSWQTQEADGNPRQNYQLLKGMKR